MPIWQRDGKEKGSKAIALNEKRGRNFSAWMINMLGYILSATFPTIAHCISRDFYNRCLYCNLIGYSELRCLLQASFYSTAFKTLISVSTVILLGLIFAYHALEVQVRIFHYSASEHEP